MSLDVECPVRLFTVDFRHDSVVAEKRALRAVSPSFPSKLSLMLLVPKGLEVELEKQHVEGYHNRIAYFGRVLAGGGAGGGASGGNGSDRCGGGSGVGMTTASLEDTANSVRLVGVYEHGDFILLR